MRITRKTMIALLTLTVALLLPLSAQAAPPDDQCSSPMSSDGHHDWRIVDSTPATCTDRESVSWQCYNCERTYIEFFPAAGHTWGPWEEYPNCVEEGLRQRQCQVCQIWESESLPPKGHDWDGGEVTVPATCSSQGVRTFTCSRCGATQTEAIEKTDHQPVRVTEVYPTCIEPGRSVIQCAICGEKLTNPDYLPALGHDWDEGKVITPATCSSQGLITFTCSRCGTTHTEATEKTNHQPEKVTEVYPTCTEGGSAIYKCAVCGEKLTNPDYLPPLGHEWGEGKVTTPATCNRQGVRTFTCSRCGATRTEAVEKTNHQPEKVTEVYPTCTESGSSIYKCAICGEKLTNPDSIPALGHDYGEWKTETPATCVQRGMKVRACERCGKEEYEYAASLGHEWDEGTVTKLQGNITSGEMTFICARCGEIRTEEIPPNFSSQDLFLDLRNVPPEAANAEYSGGLWIVTEPKGGAAALDGSVTYTLSVEAEGGVPPYTYEWHWVAEKLPYVIADDLGGDVNGLKHAVASAFESRRGEYAKAKEKGGSAASALFLGLGKELGYSLTESEEEFSDAFSGIEDLNDRIVSSGPEAEYAASQPGEYYVVVRDQTGDEAYSARVTVTETLYFTKQPKNTNLNGHGSVTLTCKAGGGSGAYLYCFRNTETGELLEKDLSQGTVTVSQPGVYVFEVDDFATGEQAVSQPVTVYDAVPLTVSGLADVSLNENESATLSATVTGGVEPYAYQWQRQENDQDSAFPSFGDLPEAAEASIEVTYAELGRYQLLVTDAMGETACASALVANPLTIIKQPEGADLSSKSTSFYLDVEISAATAPYTYTLLMEGEERDSKQTHLTTCEFEITQSGVYAIRVEDAGGRSVISQYVNVRNMALNILSNTYAASVTQLGKHVTLRVVAAGGVEPYTYSWIKISRSADFEACYAGSSYITPDFEGDTGEYAVKEPFTSWKCIVTDAEGTMAVAYPMYVNVEGTLLIITEQPQSVQLDYSKEPYKAVLKCKALASSGHPLTYTWEKKGLSGWQTCAVGDTLTLEERTTESGLYYFTDATYRCRVRDTVTREETVSDEAAVKLPPLKAKAYQAEKSMTVKLEIEGGAEPYTIACERRRNAHNSVFSYEYGVDILETLKYTFDLNGHGAGIEKDGHHYIFTYNNMPRRDKSSWIDGVQYLPWTYVFTITDGQGNTINVNTGEMKFDNTNSGDNAFVI